MASTPSGIFSDNDDDVDATAAARPRNSRRPSALRRLVAPKSPLFPPFRWAYQPVKVFKSSAADFLDRASTRRTVANYLATPGFKGLHCGCGPFRLQNWLNTDLRGAKGAPDFWQDVTKPFPIPDESLNAIYSSELVEHLPHDGPRDGLARFLSECYRTLRDGGTLRLTTPDVVEVCKLFLGTHDSVKLEQFRPYWIDGNFSPEGWLNAQFRAWGHQHLYSFEELARRVSRAGFRTVVRCVPQQSQSDLPQLQNLETRYGPDAPAWLWCRTLILEAVK